MTAERNQTIFVQFDICIDCTLVVYACRNTHLEETCEIDFKACILWNSTQIKYLLFIQIGYILKDLSMQ